MAGDTIGRMTDTTAFDWRSFLLRWSGEWADSLPDGETQSEDDETARRTRWLGFPPASAERIAAMERRLGCQMPPSYREFLKVSDGWRHAGGFVWLLAGTEDARWHNNESGLADMFEEYLDDDAGPEERREVDIWRRGLQLDVESDITHVLMDPEDVDGDGEWAVYTWASWRAAPPERHANFLEFMRDMYREFHSLQAHPSDGEPVFANDTTRKLDAQVDAARLEALRGDWERAAKTLDEAREFGRPRAAGLGDQIRRLLGQTYMVYFDGMVTDPQYAPELLPPLVAEHAAHSYRDDSTLTLPSAGRRRRPGVTGLRDAGPGEGRNVPVHGGRTVRGSGRAGAGAGAVGRHRRGMADTDKCSAPVGAAGTGPPGAPGVGGRPRARPGRPGVARGAGPGQQPHVLPVRPGRRGGAGGIARTSRGRGRHPAERTHDPVGGAPQIAAQQKRVLVVRRQGPHRKTGLVLEDQVSPSAAAVIPPAATHPSSATPPPSSSRPGT